jgi:uncharacterized protein YceK
VTLRSAWLILPAVLSVGCGTVHNINPSREILFWDNKTTRVFGGVRDDLAGLSEMGGKDMYAILYDIVIAPFFVADLPFSLVGDTLTLPYTAVYALFSQRLTSPATTEASKPPSEVQGRVSGSNGTNAPASVGRQPNRAPHAGNALADLVEYRFDTWTISHRVDMPVSPKSDR